MFIPGIWWIRLRIDLSGLDVQILQMYSFDLSIGPGVVGLGQAVFGAVGLADHVEAHGPGINGVPVPALIGKLNTPRHCLSDQWRSVSAVFTPPSC